MQRNSASRTGELTRRGAVAGAFAVSAIAPAMATESACRIGPPPHVKGPTVFMDYDQIELNAAYDQRSYAPLGDQITARFISDSAETRRRLGNPERHSYGPTAIEKLDIFRAPAVNAPIMVFVHGGAWLRNQASDFHYIAENFVRGGGHFVALDFVPVDHANGDLRVMADQVRRAIVWVSRNAASFGGDPNRIFVSGQSSGAHLAGVALVTDWAKDYGAPADILKGGVLQSGMYEMKPVRLSSRSSYIKFDDAMEDAMSSQRHIANLRAPVVVTYGTNETPEFQRQNREFAAAVKAAGKPVTLIVLPNHNHYEVQQTLASPYGWGGRAALALMGLGKA
ncbi:MAG TPA: alpha/beta hydrolase [Micropepsaceae bacterium]|nr:alpha/beta hydrolase [Micropepsaceae bacterium]